MDCAPAPQTLIGRSGPTAGRIPSGTGRSAGPDSTRCTTVAADRTIEGDATNIGLCLGRPFSPFEVRRPPRPPRAEWHRVLGRRSRSPRPAGTDHQVAIFAEYVPGGSLKKFCTKTNLLPVRQAVLVIFTMCRALDYAFQNGVIHRDIKPANILLSERDDIKISDFGTAKISYATHTQIDGFLGSPAYMSPEQINEEGPSVQTDIYSLGVVMYELLTGRLPFRAESAVAMINKILN